MIDIHTHILPNVDDGPRDWNEALALLRQGIEDGIKGAVCTSHVLNRLDENVERVFTKTFRELKERARDEGLDIKLWLASEIHCQSILEYSSPVATFNANGKYLLFELPLGDYPADTNEKIFQMSLDHIIPILAHPERNVHIMRHPETAFELANRGVLMQVNAGSLLGVFGKDVRKTAEVLLKHQLVQFVGSDCHGTHSRPMNLSKAYREVVKLDGEETAKNLFYRNPLTAIKGETIAAPPPVSFSRKKRKFLLF